MRISVRVAMSKEQLLDRLRATQALIDRGATEGEKAAAEAAKQRLLQKLESQFGYSPEQAQRGMGDVGLPPFVRNRQPRYEAPTLTPEQRKQAISWMLDGFDLQTIAEHFEMSYDDLARQLNTVKR